MLKSSMKTMCPSINNVAEIVVLYSLVKLQSCIIYGLSLQLCLYKILAQQLLTGGDFGPPQRHLAISGDIFWLSELESWAHCYWHVVYRGQGCLHPPMNRIVSTLPPKKNDQIQNGSIAEVEEPCLSLAEHLFQLCFSFKMLKPQIFMQELLKWPHTLTMKQYSILTIGMMKIIDVLFLCFHLQIM